jgi:predicted DNA-binding transcriptional regulator YafY
MGWFVVMAGRYEEMRKTSFLIEREAAVVLETSTRLLRILSLLLARREWPGPELAERLGVTTRTVRTDVDRLRSMGYAIDAVPGPGGGYRLGPGGAAIPPLLVDDDEAVAIAIGLRAAALSGLGGVEEASIGALSKLERVLPSHLRHRIASVHAAMSEMPMPGPTTDAETLLSLSAAIGGRERVRFTYADHHGRGSRRDVEPHRIVHWGRRWYLVAWDPGRVDWRTFRVDRLELYGAPGPRFEPRPLVEGDATALVRRGASRAPWATVGRVRLAMAADEATARLPPHIEIEADGPDRCVINVGSDSPRMLAAWVGLLDVDFEVLEPPELVDGVAALAHRYARAAHRSTRH